MGLTSATTAACTSASTGSSGLTSGDVAAGASSGARSFARCLGKRGRIEFGEERRRVSWGGARNGGYPRRCARPVPREWASTGWIQRSMVPATHLFAPRMSSGSPPPFFAAFPMDALDSRSNKELKGIKRKSGVGKCPPGPRCDASRLLRARDKSNARAL